MRELMSWVSYSPLVAVLLLGAIAFLTPPIFEQLRLPAVVGLLLLGAVFGDHGLGVFRAETPMVQTLLAMGQYALMFLVALELDLSALRPPSRQMVTFGLASALLPLALGAAVGLGPLGLTALGAVTLGLLLASHTLLTYGVVQRLGLREHPAVVTTVGATALTDGLALLVLALVMLAQRELGPILGGLALLKLGGYGLVVLLGTSWGGRRLLRQAGASQEGQLLVIVLAIATSVGGAIALGIEPIFGAFLAGLAVNDVLAHSPAKERLALFNSLLLVPLFYVCVGMGLDLNGVAFSLSDNLVVTLLLLAALLGGKLLAALLLRRLLACDWAEVLLVACLTLPQVATTLVTALVARRLGLLPEALFYSVIVILAATALVGPALGSRAALLVRPENATGAAEAAKAAAPQPWEKRLRPSPSEPPEPPVRIVVPLGNPATQANLLAFAQLLSQPQGQILPLAIAASRAPLDQPELRQALARSEQRLAEAQQLLQGQAQVEPCLRIDDRIPEGISRAARERDGDLIVMGWSELDLRSRLLGNATSRVFSLAHCPVVVTRLLLPPAEIQRILVPVKAATPEALRLIRLAQVLAQGNGASIKLLHVCDRATPLAQVRRLEATLTRTLGQSLKDGPLRFRTMIQADPAPAIVTAAAAADLLMLRSVRRRTAGGMTVGDTTTRVIRRVHGSIVLLGEPAGSS